MGRTMYVCVTCGQHFTGRYSSTRHNFNIHRNGGEIVPLLEYLVGRNWGRYPARTPVSRRMGSGAPTPIPAPTPRVVADSMGDFRYRGMQQQGQYRGNNYPYQEQQRLSRLQTPSPSPTADQISQHLNNNGTTITTAATTVTRTPTTSNKEMSLTEETVSKIVELKRGMWRHSNVFPNPDEVIQYVKYFCMNGDNTFLDERLEQLHILEAAT